MNLGPTGPVDGAPPMFYYLRNVPQPLWAKAHMKATTEGLTLRAVIIKALRVYVRGDLPQV